MRGGGSSRALTSGGRAEVAAVDGGGKEREGRAGPPGVEGVGPGPAVGTRPGAWTPAGGARRLPSETGRAEPR